MSQYGAPEQYDSLEGVPDPSETALVHGHGEQARLLASAYRSGRLPHALLFGGPRGIGKATLAFHLARHILAYPDHASAPEFSERSDPGSPLFRRVASRAHPGLLHLTRPRDDKARKFRTAITVEEIRSISRFVGLTAHDGGYRTVIVDAADDMNRNAANALLKNLEEPPARTVFILISHMPGRLLPTIRSRCQFLRFNPLREHEIREILDSVPGSIDAELRDDAVANCGGSAREAILLAHFGGLEIGAAIREFADRPGFDPRAADKISAAVSGKGNDVSYDLFNDAVLAYLSGKAREAATGGDNFVAARFSRLWEETNRQIGEAAAYNLDRRQHVLSVLASLDMTTRN